VLTWGVGTDVRNVVVAAAIYAQPAIASATTDAAIERRIFIIA
jgi:hypothetical protein